MICKKCSAEYEDNYDRCPECAAEDKQTENTVQEAVTESESEVLEEESAPPEAEDKDKEPEEIVTESDEVEKEALTEKTDKAETAEESKAVAEVKKAEDVKKVSAPAIAKRPARGSLNTVKLVTKKEKKISAVLVVLVCLVGVLAIALSVVNITTDMFEASGDGEKMVAGVGLVPQEEKKLEAVLAKCFSVAKKEYNSESADVEAFLERISPADKGNVFSLVNNTAATVKTEPDPAKRFGDENGEYSYYKIEKTKIDKVLSLFGLESYRVENYKDYYYCDGYYYFAASEVNQTPVVLCEITKSRRVLDGSYYVEAYFYVENEGGKVKTDSCYFVVEMTVDEAIGEESFVIKKISAKPIFAADGSLAQQQIRDSEKDIVEGVTDDGKLYCRYILEHPLFGDENNGYAHAKEFFKNSVSVYKLKAEDAQESYKEFKKKGGTDAQLPLIEVVTASVTFEDEKYFSIVEKISTFETELKEEKTDASELQGDTGAEEKDDSAKLSKRSVEAYTFDKETGDFVSKDSVLGKDYLTIRKLLYRICNSYSYEDILPKKTEEEESQEGSAGYSEQEDYEEIPEDTNYQGAAVYESAWALTDEGVTFYYVTDMGYVQQVTVPYDVVERLKA